MANKTSFRYPNNVNTHKKKVNSINKTRTGVAINEAHNMRNNQNVAVYKEKEEKSARKIEFPVI